MDLALLLLYLEQNEWSFESVLLTGNWNQFLLSNLKVTRVKRRLIGKMPPLHLPLLCANWLHSILVLLCFIDYAPPFNAWRNLFCRMWKQIKMISKLAGEILKGDITCKYQHVGRYVPDTTLMHHI